MPDAEHWQLYFNVNDPHAWRVCCEWLSAIELELKLFFRETTASVREMRFDASEDVVVHATQLMRLLAATESKCGCLVPECRDQIRSAGTAFSGVLEEIARGSLAILIKPYDLYDSEFQKQLGCPPIGIGRVGLDAIVRLQKSVRNVIDELEKSPLDSLKAASSTQSESGATKSDDCGNNPFYRLVSVFTGGLANELIDRAVSVLQDDDLRTNDKLTKINSFLPLPANASAEKLGDMLGVSKQAVMKTAWWIDNRKGEKASEIGRRRDWHQDRSKRSDQDRPIDEK
jgi:hypothetical protein